MLLPLFQHLKALFFINYNCIKGLEEIKTTKGWENIHSWFTLNTQTLAYRGRGREMFSMHMERCGCKSQGRPLSASLHWRQPEALRLNHCLTPDLRSARTGWRWTTANESKVCFCNHRSCKHSAKRCCTFPLSAQNQINSDQNTEKYLHRTQMHWLNQWFEFGGRGWEFAD